MLKVQNLPKLAHPNKLATKRLPKKASHTSTNLKIMKIPRNIRRSKTCANYVNTHDKKPPKNSSKKKYRMSYGYKCRNNNTFNFYKFVKMRNFGLKNKFVVILSSNIFLNHADENVAFFGETRIIYTT